MGPEVPDEDEIDLSKPDDLVLDDPVEEEDTSDEDTAEDPEASVTAHLRKRLDGLGEQ